MVKQREGDSVITLLQLASCNSLPISEVVDPSGSVQKFCLLQRMLDTFEFNVMASPPT